MLTWKSWRGQPGVPVIPDCVCQAVAAVSVSMEATHKLHPPRAVYRPRSKPWPSSAPFRLLLNTHVLSFSHGNAICAHYTAL